MLYKFQILITDLSFRSFWLTSFVIPCIVLCSHSSGISQKNNDFALGLRASGSGVFIEDKSVKDIYSFEISPSLGFQVMDDLYVYATGGMSFSNFNEQELFHFGYITRKFIKKYKFLNFYAGQNFSLTNISYEQSETGKIQKLNPRISGFTFGIEAGLHMSIYKNFGIILNTGYNYDYGRGVNRNRLLNLTLQMDIHRR